MVVATEFSFTTELMLMAGLLVPCYDHIQLTGGENECWGVKESWKPSRILLKLLFQNLSCSFKVSSGERLHLWIHNNLGNLI